MRRLQRVQDIMETKKGDRNEIKIKMELYQREKK